jgi:hypothetical protein
MSEPHERIWAKNGHDSWGQYGHWYADSKGGGVEYVLADRIEELEAKLAKAMLALDEAIYLLDPDEEDIAKETGLHRIVTIRAELKGKKPTA